MQRFIFICLIILMGAGYWLQGELPKPLVIGYHEDFPPYFFEKEGGISGIFPVIINEVATKMNIKVRYKKFPWKRMINNAKIGELDAVIPLFKTKERQKFLCFPDNGIAVGECSLFTLNDTNVQYNGKLRDLRSRSIGCVEGYWYGEEFDRAEYFRKEKSPSDEALLDMLLNRRFEAGVSAESVILHYAKKRGVEKKITIQKPPFMRGILYIGFSKNKKYCNELKKKFSDAIQELKKNGKHREILKKYGRGDDIVFIEELVIGGDIEDYRPYCFWENNKIKGACVDIIEAAAEIIGLKIRFEPIRWNQFPSLIEQGEIDAVMPLFRTQDRENYLYYYGDGLLPEKNCFFTLKNKNQKYSGELSELKDIIFGTLKNYRYGEDFDNLKNINKKEFDDIRSLISALKAGKVQVGIGNKYTIRHFTEKKGMQDNIEFLNPPLPPEPLYLAFTRLKGEKYQKLAMSFSDAIQILKLRGDYGKILENYGLENHIIKIATDDWPPYYSQRLKDYGPLAEIVTTAFQRMGYGVEITFIPRINLLDRVKNGDCDGWLASAPTVKENREYYHSDIILKSSPLKLYMRRDAGIVYTGIRDMENYRVGVVRGDGFNPKIFGIKGKTLSVSNSAEANFNNLLEGRLDIVVIDKLHARYFLEKKFKNIENKFESVELYPEDGKREARPAVRLFFSKKSENTEKLKIDFNYGLKTIKKDGTFNIILKKHGVKNVINDN